MKELLLGCGNSRLKRIAPNGSSPPRWQDLTTVDMDAGCKPDHVFNLNAAVWFGNWATANTYDEIHAYEVLEHLGHQGNYVEFFHTFAEIYRLLKPNGFLCFSVPSMASRWAWGDPGHTRIISPESLTFLDQAEYAKQIGSTAMSDYRWIWKDDFKITGHRDDNESFLCILQAVKPSRIKI